MMWDLVPITKSKSMEHNTYIWGRKNQLYMEMGPKKKNVYHPCCVGFLSSSRDEFKELSEKNSFLICKKLCRFVGWIGRVFFARGTSPGQKWWQTLLGREISCSQWEDPSMHSRGLAFFSFQVWQGVLFLFIFPWFPMCSHYVPLSSQCVLIEPHFYPRCFGRSCPPFTYVGGPKGKNSILQNRTFYFGEPS
jgi:hypothetical protein